MAWASEGSVGSNNSKASGTTVVITTSQTVPVDDYIVVITAWDNNNGTTISGPNADTWTVTDSAGNTYDFLAGGEDAGANSHSAAGILIAKVTSELASSSSITVTYNSTRTAKAASAWRFSTSEGGGYRLCALGVRHDRASDPSDMALRFPGLDAVATDTVLILHCLSAEGPNTDAYTWDADYTQFTSDGTTGSTDDTNMHVRGGFRITDGISEDQISISSDTADRDYTQLMCVLYEIPASEPAIPALDPIYDGTGFQYVDEIGDGYTSSLWGCGPWMTSNAYMRFPVSGAPVGSLLTVNGAFDNNNNVTETGPNDTRWTCSDSEGNTWTKVCGADHALASAQGAFGSQFACVVTNEIPLGGWIELTAALGAGSSTWCIVGVCHLWKIEDSNTLSVESVTMQKGAGSGNPPAISLSSLTSRRYLFLWTNAWETSPSTSWTWDSTFTEISRVGYETGENEANMSAMTGYLITDATGATYNSTSSDADPDSVQLLSALYTSTVNTPFTQRTTRYFS